MERMREELVRRNYATTTIHSYLKAVEHFRSHVDTPIDEVGPDDLRSYHAYLLGTRKLAVNTVVLNICALRFLYIKVLKRRDMKEDLPYPKKRLRLPVILSPDEVAQLIGTARNLYHRTILMTLYSTGLRRAELCRLKVADVDSKRMMLRVVQGKGGIDREVPLSKKLRGALREYYRWMRPETYLFPGLSVLRAITRCRTAALGGHIDQCSQCGHEAISYNSCRNRHCPKCQAQARQRWLAAREKDFHLFRVVQQSPWLSFQPCQSPVSLPSTKQSCELRLLPQSGSR